MSDKLGFISDIEKASILNNGINFFNQRQYGLAKIQFDRYLNTYGYDKWVVEIKANCHMLLQEYEEDIDKYEKLLKDDPKNTDNLFFIYYDLMKLERYEEALEYCDKLLEINPYNKDYKNYKINCLKKLGKSEEEAKMETSRQLAEQKGENTYKTEWVECPKCGRKISSMAIEIHKKCPHCSHQFKKLKNQSLGDDPKVSEKQSELDESHKKGKGIKSKVKRFFG